MVQSLLDEPGTSTPAAAGRNRPKMTPDGLPDVNQLGWEVAELKKQVHSGFAQMRQDMRDQLTRLEGTVERMAFVDVKLYNSEQGAQDRQIAETVRLIAAVEKRMSDRIDSEGKRIDDAEKGNRATLFYLVGIVLIALAAGLVRLATG